MNLGTAQVIRANSRHLPQGWSPAGVCVECGEGRKPIVHKALDLDHVQKRTTSGLRDLSEPDSNGRGINSREPTPNGRTLATITGYACACVCECPPCPGRGNDGHGMTHCAECCFGTGVEADPSCPTHGTAPPTRPSVVLDPFGGTGTTALVAKALGRHGITIDMSADYCRLAEWRTNDRNQLAKVLGIEKAPTVDVQQLDLFGEATA